MGAKGAKKTGGRKKGTPNKRTLSLLDQLEQLNLNIPNEIYRLLNQLDNLDCMGTSDSLNVIRAKANIYLDLMQYLYPKRKAIDIIDHNLNGTLTVYDFRHDDEEPSAEKADFTSFTDPSSEED